VELFLALFFLEKKAAEQFVPAAFREAIATNT
jgi:hypothetical protein